MVDFTNGPAPAGFLSPQRFEADIYDCEVEGSIPKDLNGAFVRVGGEWFYPPSRPDDSPFSTDGYISSFRIREGIVDFRGRWVQTPRSPPHSQWLREPGRHIWVDVHEQQQ